MAILLMSSIASGHCSAFALEGTQPAQSVSSTPSTADELSLGDLRDIGLCLMQIKQQSINIYLEVTRKAIPAKSSAEMEEPSRISDAGLTGQSTYLPTRIEWLTLYVGIMEPIIHLFKQDLKDAESGVQKITVPKGTKDKFEKLFDAYETGVQQLNVHLTNIYDQRNLPDNNVKIAKEAVKIFDLVTVIEKDRQEAFRLIQQSAGKTDVELLVPNSKKSLDKP